MVELAPLHAALRGNRTAAGVDANPLHQRHVDDHAAVVRSVAGRAMAAAAQREEQLVRTSEIDGVLHVGGTGAAYDQRWATIDISIPDPPCGFIARAVPQDELTADAAAKVIDVGVAQPGIGA